MITSSNLEISKKYTIYMIFIVVYGLQGSI